jgi:hypothetical protein
MRSAVVWSTRPGQRFRNSSSVIKGAASNVGCGCVRSRPPGPPADRNHKTRRHPTDSPAEKLPGARIWKRWGAKREDAWRLRLRRGSASVRWWLFLASQPLQPCQLHDFNFAGGSENAGIPEFRLTSQALRKCTTGPSPCAQVHLLRTLGISAPSCGALSEQYSYKTTTVGSTRDLIHPVEGPAKMCVTQLR